MKNIGMFILAMAAGLVLTGCGATGPTETKVDTQSVQANPAAMAEQYIKVNDARQLKNEPSKKIFIAAFRVGFLTNTSASATAYGGIDGSKKPVTARVRMGLDGLNNSQLQQMTDSLYTLVVNDLKSMGYEVLSPEQLASTDYQVLKSEAKNSPQTIEIAKNKYSVFSPAAVPLTLLPGEGGFLSSFSAFDSKNRVQVVPKIIKQTGASAIDVNITINFAKGEASGGYFSSRASAELRPMLHVLEGSGITFTSHKETTDMSVRMGHTIPPATSVYVAKSIDYPGQFGKLVDKTTFMESLVGGATGSVIEVDMTQFRPMSEELLTNTRLMLMAKMKASK